MRISININHKPKKMKEVSKFIKAISCTNNINTNNINTNRILYKEDIKCKYCNIIKSKNEFRKNSRRCKECMRHYDRTRYKKKIKNLHLI